MITTPTKWLRVARSRRCPVCNSTNWCLIAADGTAAICPRTPSGKWIGKNGGGYLHKLDGSLTVSPAAPPERHAPVKSRPELANLMRGYRTAINPDKLERLAAVLGVTVASLNRLGIGWAFDRNAWAFPMTGEGGELLGVRLRRDDGRKFSITGGHEGLFIAADLPLVGPLVFCEGPTSAAALLDLEFQAIGRPSCMGGVGLVCDLIERRGRVDVVIFGDRDEAKPRPDGSVWFPGQDGAKRLAQEILPLCRSVKVILPPFHKDARDWKKAGATRGMVEAVIKAANYARKTAT